MATCLESPRRIVPPVSIRQHPWAVLLAGGDGTRLQSLTMKIAGDSRPKQFCRLFDGKSLLDQTRQRIQPLFRRDKTMFVVTRAHERYYRELLGAESSRVIEQPRNRGTGVAIATALFHILQVEDNPLVAFFPCDHYYANDYAFGSAVKSALAAAEEYPRSIVLLGADAHYPETEYGWIEPVSAMGRQWTGPLRVNRFWEKPSLQTARALVGRGCLWNTFVTAGRADTFLELLCSQIPDAMLHLVGVAEEDMNGAYARVRSVDFSREVLAQSPHRLMAVRDGESGWADLGNPTRVVDTMVRNRIEPAWLADYR